MNAMTMIDQEQAAAERRDAARAQLADMRLRFPDVAVDTDARIRRLIDYRQQEGERVTALLKPAPPLSLKMQKIVAPAERVKPAFELTDILDRTSNGMREIGKAYRRKPMIMTLLAQGILSSHQYTALHVYRHYASLADKSPIRDSLCIDRNGGRGAGPTNELLHAQMMAAKCEREAGSLSDILRAVAVDDRSLSDWAIQMHGGTEKKRARGSTIEPTAKGLEISRVEIKMAATRVQSCLTSTG